MNFSLSDHLVLQVYGGSHAYGTSTEESDEDLRGIIIPPEEYFLGLKSFKNCTEDPEMPEADICYYDIRQFFHLALKGNPNILEIFKSPRIKVVSPFANSILDMWSQVLSKSLVKSHLGMAIAHLNRVNLKNRNCGQTGKNLIDKYGYNTKEAMHIIRVLEQCVEILVTKDLKLPRPNADILLSIKNGEWSIEKVRHVAQTLIDIIKKLESKSSLSSKPRFNLVSKNVNHIVHGWIYYKRK